MKGLTIDPHIKSDPIGYREQAIVFIQLPTLELYLAQDNFVIRISDLDMHPDLWTGGSKSICSGIIQLNLAEKSDEMY